MSTQSSQQCFANTPIPVRAGIGLRFDHIHAILDRVPDIGWLEIHAENFMSDGGPSIRLLEKVRSHYPISIHGVGLSIGGASALDKTHLKRLKYLADWIEPGLVSEHLSWCGTSNGFLNDLLPLPYDQDALAVVSQHIDQVQTALGRSILIENPSLYTRFHQSEMTEPEFLNEVARRTGCGLLLDVNNIFVSASNLDFDPVAYLDQLDMTPVGEVHLAGHHVRQIGDTVLRIDDHGSPVSDPVWRLYRHALARAGMTPTLIEWDTNIPALDVLLAEADRAESLLSEHFFAGGRDAAVA